MYMNDMIANMSSMISGACMGTGVIRFKLVSSLRVKMMMLNVYSTNRTLFSVLAICFLI